jgi:hypothetical protein
MEWKLPVRREGREVGTLFCAGDGLRTSFRLDCPGSRAGEIEKLWLEGHGRYLLGTPVPVGETLTLRRMVSNRQLEQLRPITGAVLTTEDGANHPPLPDAIQDRELREMLQGTGFTLSQQGEEILLSWPWRPGEELPVSGLFTMMTWKEGRLWLSLQKGWPKLGGR